MNLLETGSDRFGVKKRELEAIERTYLIESATHQNSDTATDQS